MVPIGAAFGVADGLVAAFLPLGIVQMLSLFLALQVLANGTVWAGEWAHVRNRAFVGAMGALAGLSAVYASWVAYAVGLGEGSVDPWTALDPRFLWALASALADGNDVKWTLWAVGAVALVGFPAQAAGRFPSVAYCERCGLWAEPLRTLLVLGENARADVRGAVERMDLTALAAMEPATPRSDSVHVLNLYGCPQCDGARTISLGQVSRAAPGMERTLLAGEQRGELVRQRLVSAEEISALESLADAWGEVHRAG